MKFASPQRSYSVAVTIALHDLAVVAASLRADIKRGRFNDIAEHLKFLHDGVRGLRTELDLRNDSVWGKQLTSIRSDISNSLQSEIDSVPGRVRRLLRQRPDKDLSASSRVDASEVDETAALIDFVAVCRTYASELAINEVTLRTYSDLQHYVEQSTKALVESLRGGGRQGRGLPADAGQGGHPFLRGAVWPRLCVADEPGRRKLDARRAETVSHCIKIAKN